MRASMRMSRGASLAVVVLVVGIMLLPPGLSFARANSAYVPTAVPRDSPSAAHPTSGALEAAVASVNRGLGPGAGMSLSCSVGGIGAAGCLAPATPTPAAGGSKLTWTNLTGLSKAPNGEYLASMVYDAADHLVLLFGGSYSGHTWTFANGTWTDITSTLSSSPGGRLAAFITYDWGDGYVLMYGGEQYAGGTCSPSYNGFCGDTWTFHAGSWTHLTPSPNPGARWRGGLAYDVKDGYAVLFGGTDSNATAKADTWEYNNGSWKDVTKSVTGAPPALFRQSLVYDGNDSYLVMYGGANSAGNPTDITWKYSGGTWSNITSTAGTPASRVYTELAYDNATGQIVMYGGWLIVLAPPDAQDTWTFSGGKWTNITANLSKSPPPLGGGAIAYDIESQILIEFGGDTSNGGAGTIYNSTWVYGPPVIAFASATPPAIDLGQSVNFTVRGFSNHPPVKYNYSGLPPGCAFAGSRNITCTPTSVGAYTVKAWANDTVPESANVTIAFAVTLPPSGAGLIADRNPVTVGFPVHLTAHVSGGAKPLTYSYAGLPAGCGPTNAQNFTCNPTASGRFPIGLTVTDSRGGNATAQLILNVVPVPTVTSFVANPPLLDLGQSTNFVVMLVNGAPPFTYAYSGLPNGCVSASTANLSCAPTATGTFSIVVNVTDSSGANTTSAASLGVNATPTVSSFTIAPNLVDVGVQVTFTATASGGTGYLSYSFTNLPPGCSGLVNVSVGVCTPTQAGTYAVTFNATDTVQGYGTRSVTLIVHASPAVSSVTASRSNLDVGQNLTVRVHVTGGTAPFRFSFSNLPASCGAPSTQNVSCIVRNQGVYGGTVTVTDTFGKAASGSVPQFSAYSDPSIQSIVLNPEPAIVGSVATITVAAIGGSTAYSYNYSGLPPGCTTMNSSQLTCTPTQTGSFIVSVTVNDSYHYSATATHVVNVTTAPSGTGLLGLPGNDGLYLIIGIVAVAAVIAAVLLLRRKPSPSPSAPVEETPAPEPPEGQP